MTPQEAIELIKWTPLMRYEADMEEKSELGQALDMAIKALEKQIPKKPIEENVERFEVLIDGTERWIVKYFCPHCRKQLVYAKPYRTYTCECGTKIDWRESDERSI